MTEPTPPNPFEWLFTIAFAEFSDHSDGVIVQCQECGQILEIQKD